MGWAILDTCFELQVRADASDVREASVWLEQTGRTKSVPSDQLHKLDMCLNEALANIIEHGGPAAQLSPVRISFDAKVNSATLTITDSGLAFNPLVAVHKLLPLTLAEVEPGGLGLGLMSSFSDDVAYVYEQGRNCLTFTVRWSEAV